MNYPFDTTELATLDSGDSLSTIVQLRGLMRGIQIENRTPAFWQVVDDSGTVWFKIPPWSITQGRFPESQQVVIETEPNSPLFSLSTVTDTEYRLGYELFREALPYQVMNLVTGLVQVTGSNVPLTANAPTLLATVPYGKFTALAYSEYLKGVFHRNARQRTFVVLNETNQGLNTVNLSMWDSAITATGNPIVSDSFGMTAPGSGALSVVASEEGSNGAAGRLAAHLDSIQVSMTYTTTAPTSGNVLLYVVELL